MPHIARRFFCLPMLLIVLVFGVCPAWADDAAGHKVTGKVQLPEELPGWFIGGKLDVADAKISVYFEKSDQDFPLVAETQAAGDGSFSVLLNRKGTYYLAVSIPHKQAGEDEFGLLVWAYAEKELNIRKKDGKLDVGVIGLELQNVLMPGDQAPEWIGESYDGKEVRLSDFRGRYVLLDFWATWCGPCIDEMPNLKKTYDAFGGDRFEVIALNLDDKLKQAKKFLQENPSGYTHVYLGAGWEDETVTRDYGVDGIPTIMLIGPDGTIIERDLRGKAIFEAVKKTLDGAE